MGRRAHEFPLDLVNHKSYRHEERDINNGGQGIWPLRCWLKLAWIMGPVGLSWLTGLPCVFRLGSSVLGSLAQLVVSFSICFIRAACSHSDACSFLSLSSGSSPSPEEGHKYFQAAMLAEIIPCFLLFLEKSGCWKWNLTEKGPP